MALLHLVLRHYPPSATNLHPAHTPAILQAPVLVPDRVARAATTVGLTTQVLHAATRSGSPSWGYNEESDGGAVSKADSLSIPPRHRTPCPVLEADNSLSIPPRHRTPCPVLEADNLGGPFPYDLTLVNLSLTLLMSETTISVYSPFPMSAPH